MPAVHHRSFSSDNSDTDIVKVSPSPGVDHKYSVKEADVKPAFHKEHLMRKGGQVDDVGVHEMVEDAVRRVREQSDRFQAAAIPIADKTRNLAERRPVLFTFLTIFTVFGLIPVCCFVGFLASATMFILGVAAVGICVSVLGCIIFGASLLLPTLFITSLISLSILTFLLSLFLLHRLYLHLSQSMTTSTGTTQADYDTLSKGVKAWLGETAGRIDPGFDFGSLGLTGKAQDIEIVVKDERVGGQGLGPITPKNTGTMVFDPVGKTLNGAGGVGRMEAHIPSNQNVKFE